MTLFRSGATMVLSFLSSLPFSGCYHETHETHVIDGPFRSLKIIVSAEADVVVIGTDRADIAITVSSYYRPADSYEFAHNNDDGNVLVSIDCTNETNHFYAYLKVTVPNSIPVSIENNGDITARSLNANIQLAIPKAGDAKLDSIAGNVVAFTENGTISADGITGRLDATAINGTILLQNISGNNTLPTDPAHSSLETPSALPHTSVFVHSGAVDAQNLVGNATIEVVDGSIFVKEIDGQLVATTETGNIMVEDNTGDLNLLVREKGNIIGVNADCDSCSAETASGYVDI